MKIFHGIFVLFLAAALAEEIIKIDDLKRLANQARGYLDCEGSEMKYRLPDKDILAITFNDTTAMGNASVESVRIGLSNAAQCFATRYPQNSLHNSFATVLAYNQCNFTATPNYQEKTITYSGDALITIKIDAFRKKRFSMGLHCIGPLDGQISASSQYIPYQVALDNVTQSFGLTFDALSKQEVRPSFGNFITQTNVHIIKIELDEKHQADYSIIANKCWATPTPDPDSTIRYDFLKPQSCSVGGYVVQKRVGTHKIIYEVADFEFDEPTDTLYFHCQLNVCVKMLQDESLCEVCPITNKRILSRNRGLTGFQMRTAATARHPSLRPQVEIGADGKIKSAKNKGNLV